MSVRSSKRRWTFSNRRPPARASSCEKHLATPECLVFGDPQRLQQVVWHLLSNAIKFTPRGGRAKVTVRPVGATCQIVVSDTGAGIANELLPYVFDRFWRAEAPDEHRYSGPRARLVAGEATRRVAWRHCHCNQWRVELRRHIHSVAAARRPTRQ